MFLVILLLIAVVIWMAVTFRSRMAVRDCIWRANRSLDGPEGHYWMCVNCGAERYEPDGPPRQCHRPDEG